MLDFHICGVQTNKQNENNYEIGQILASGALDDTKKMGKAGADIFAKSEPEKSSNKLEKFKIFSGFFPMCPVNFPKNP